MRWRTRRLCTYSRRHCAGGEILCGEKHSAVGKLTNQLATPGTNRGKARGQGGDRKLPHGRGGCEQHQRCDTLAEHDAMPPSRATLPGSQQRSSRRVEGPGVGTCQGNPAEPRPALGCLAGGTGGTWLRQAMLFCHSAAGTTIAAPTRVTSAKAGPWGHGRDCTGPGGARERNRGERASDFRGLYSRRAATCSAPFFTG